MSLTKVEPLLINRPLYLQLIEAIGVEVTVHTNDMFFPFCQSMIKNTREGQNAPEIFLDRKMLVRL